jgi:cell division protein FtsB
MPHRRHAFSHTKELYYILCFAAALFVFFFGMIGPGGYLELKKARQDLAVQQARVEKLQRAVSEQMRTIDSLKNDPAALEDYLRKRGYAREGELIQELPPSPSDPKIR